MKSYVGLFALLSIPVFVNASSWSDYKAKYGKQYASPGEDSMRHAIYLHNLARIQAHNSLNIGYELGVNHLTDLKQSEYRQLCGYKSSQKDESGTNGVSNKFLVDLLEDESPLPESVDYSQMGDRVSPVKNQGQCGSCWAFSTTGLLEGQEYKVVKRDQVVPLSEQELVDCDHQDSGCNGGLMELALNFIKKAGGLESEQQYPYVSGDGRNSTQRCNFDPGLAEVSTRHVEDVIDLPSYDEGVLKKVVARYGPVAVAIDASCDSFRHYKSGVLYDEDCPSIEILNHGVLVVGYGYDPEQGDYWLVKNSWSTEWGDKGYIKVARNKQSYLGIAAEAVIFNTK